MPKTADQAIKSTKKALKKIDKLTRKSKEAADQRLAQDGMVTMPVFKETRDRYRARYEQRVPASLLLTLAMDAVDAGTLQLPSTDEALVWYREEVAKGRANAKNSETKTPFLDLLNGMFSGKGDNTGKQDTVEMIPHLVTVDDLARGTDRDGNPIPPEVMDALHKALGIVLPPKAPPVVPSPNQDNVIRFTNDPDKAGDESDQP